MAMLLLHSPVENVAVVIAGHGLIGSAIESALLARSRWTIQAFPFAWGESFECERNSVFQNVYEVLARIVHATPCSIHCVWSAGVAGFASNRLQTELELRTFRQFAAFCAQTQRRSGMAVHLHMTSSAGGLFEGTRMIESETRPSPRRAYGWLKHEQEQIAGSTVVASSSIYRPTSVYSTIQTGQRMGLVPTMIDNVMRNRVTQVYGNRDTLRDYVWASDIGRFVAERVLGWNPPLGQQRFLLATGVPTPIFRVIQVIESVLMRRVPVQFISPTDDNQRPITVCPHSVPVEFRRTDLVTAIRLICARLANDGVPAINVSGINVPGINVPAIGVPALGDRAIGGQTIGR